MGAAKKPVIAVSACLLGQNVRYDGKPKACALVRDELARHAELIPLCPETGVGMPVPREAVDLLGDPADPRMVGVTSGQDWTDRVNVWVEAALDRVQAAGVSAFVLKARSPSCGVGTAAVYPQPGAEAVNGDGLLAAAIRRRFPHLLMVEDEGLNPEVMTRLIFP